MKKKGREEAKKNIIKKSLSAAIAAVLVGLVLIASMPLAAAGAGTSLTITPNTSITGKVAAYDVAIDTPGFESLDMTIPAGFRAVEPGCGGLIAEIWLWDDEGNEYYINLTSNCTKKIDLVCVCDGDEVKYTFNASYGEGDTIEVIVSCWGESFGKLKLPTSGADGSLELTSASKTITKVLISIKQFVENPAACGNYKFSAKVNNGTAVEYTVYIRNNPGDIKKDGVVNVLDLQRLAWAWRTSIGEPNWEYCADLKNDGTINGLDLAILAQNYRNVYV